MQALPSPLVATLLISGLIGLIAAAARDVRDRIIPNSLVVFVACAGLILRLTTGWAAIGLSIIGAALVFIIVAFLAHRNYIGGGDAKLVTAATFMVPAGQIVPLLLDIALAGGLLSCFYLVLLFIEKKVRHPIRRFMQLLLHKKSHVRMRRKSMLYTSLPYALAILGGVAACTLSEVLQCFDATSCSL